jgi:hypothetical protein
MPPLEVTSAKTNAIRWEELGFLKGNLPGAVSVILWIAGWSWLRGKMVRGGTLTSLPIFPRDDLA